jgi:hypothetical protein
MKMMANMLQVTKDRCCINRSISLAAISVLAVVLFGCGRNPTSPDSRFMDQTVPGNHFEPGRLGLGFDSFTKSFKSAACVAGNVLEVGSSLANMEYLQDLTASQLTRRMGITLGWSVPMLALSPELEFVKTSSATSMSNTYSVLLEMRAKSKVLASESLALNPAAASLAGLESGRVFKACGDEYISRIDYGGALLATLKLEFSTKQDKTEFTAKAAFKPDPARPGGAPLIANGAFSRLNEKLRMRTRVVVSARQFGGSPARLLQIMPAGAVTCTLENLAPCATLFENLVTYSKESFPQQFDAPETFVPVSYQTRSYENELALSAALSWPKFAGAARAAMTQLGDKAQELSIQRLKIEKLLGTYQDDLAPARKAQLERMSRSVADGVRQNDLAMQQCALVQNDQGLETACSPPALDAFDAAVIDEPIVRNQLRRTFDSPQPLQGFELKSNRPQFLTTRHDVSAATLEIAMQSDRRQSCERQESVVLSFPAQIDREGMYVFDSALQPAPCEACGVSIEVAVDDTPVASATTDPSGSLPVLGNSTAVRLQPGLHQFSIQVSGKNVCGGKGFGVTISEYAVRQVIRPFDTGAGAAGND